MAQFMNDRNFLVREVGPGKVAYCWSVASQQKYNEWEERNDGVI